ncbi:hypothetical protein [Stygiolobus caldivivus]|uniref:Uncharacterized protein n=1 Tax=Stygiolobus caldivivus TaxID=2824673 RepID=A0A8D5ZJD4_9CREN|nr:hypothetical protein [Stygiolobus caldivivus]BCU70052.1 hypothetical protein KN1_13490 [Stygiolobus caldivivus]
MSVFNEVLAVLGTIPASVLVYLLTGWAQQRSKRNNIMRLVGYVYRPLYYFINIKFYLLLAYMSMQASITFGTLLILYKPLGVKVNAAVPLGSYFAFAILLIFYVNLDGKRKTVMEKLVKESQYVIPDVDSLYIRWKKVFRGVLGLSIKYFVVILAITLVSTTIVMVIDSGFDQIGLILLSSLLGSLTIIMLLHRFFVYPETEISIFDTDTEIEEKLFELIKDPAYCVCVIDNSGNEYCGNLEGISYGVSIKQGDGTTVNVPYESVSRAKSCPKSRNTSSIPQPYQ